MPRFRLESPRLIILTVFCFMVLARDDVWLRNQNVSIVFCERSRPRTKTENIEIHGFHNHLPLLATALRKIWKLYTWIRRLNNCPATIEFCSLSCSFVVRVMPCENDTNIWNYWRNRKAIYQTRKRVFDHISKHREESWKYEVQRCILEKCWKTTRQFWTPPKGHPRLVGNCLVYVYQL